MAQPNEITIRLSSPMRFIDDDSDTAEESAQSLSVARRRNRSPDKGDGSDTSPMPSLSPKTPTSRDNQIVDTRQKRQPFELTIRGENTIISIQTLGGQEKDHKKDAKEEGDVYDYINEQVKQIFSTPEREEIEKAMETAGGRETIKQRIFKKKGLWETLSKAAKESEKSRRKQKEQDERYPSIVLLQDPPEEKTPEDQYPKMIMFGGKCEDKETDRGNTTDRRKFEFRSKSMMNLTSQSAALNELCLERQALEMKKSYLEQEKSTLEVERRELESEKSYIQKEMKTLDRGKTFLKQDRQILNEKKQVLENEKALSYRKENDKSIVKKERLCLAMEKQLIEDEKKMIGDVEGLLKKEKAMIEKERCILGGEKNILEEEREILGKEKKVLEKQRSFVEDGRKMTVDGSEDVALEDVDAEIEDVFEEALNLSEDYSRSRRGHHRGCGQAMTDVALPFSSSPCNVGNTYPVYIPVYNLPRHMPQTCRSCPHGGTIKRTKSIQTQTEIKKAESRKSRRGEPSVRTNPNCAGASEGDLGGVPFGILSGLFPRVVITSMKIPGEGAEEGRDDGKNVQITEIPTEGLEAIQGPHEIRRSEGIQASIIEGSSASLQPPLPDLTLKAASTSGKMKQCDSMEEPETEESGFHTLSSEFYTKDEFCPLSDETMSVENIHFGYADDFYSNETILPKSPDIRDEETTARLTARSENLPLTSVGQSMYEKLTQLTLEEPAQVEFPGGNEESRHKKQNFQVNLRLGGANVNLTLSGQVTINLTSSTNQPCADKVTITTNEVKEEEKPEILRSRLWHHTGDSSFEKKKRTEERKPREELLAGPSLTLSLSGEQDSTLIVTENQEASTVSLALNPTPKCTCFCQNFKSSDDNEFKTTAASAETSSELSPRTATLLQALKDKLEGVQPGKAAPGSRTQWGGNRNDQAFTGLYLVRQLSSPRKPQPGKNRLPLPHKKLPRKEPLPREYFCEECLATMRLYEDDFISVQNMVDKFEAMSRLGMH